MVSNAYITSLQYNRYCEEREIYLLAFQIITNVTTTLDSQLKRNKINF
jgi:hypothetical protein